MSEEKISNVVWGVEFGGSAVRRICLTRLGAGYRAERYSVQPLEARWSAAPDIISAAGKLASNEISAPLVACIADDLVLYRAIQLPKSDERTLEKMIHSQLEVLIPTQTDQFVTAWGAFADPFEEALQRVMICAVRRESLAMVTESCKRLGNGDWSIVPSMLALATAWGQWTNSTEPVVLIDPAARSTSVAIVQGGHVWNCAVMDGGGDCWTERIAEALDISCEDAEQRKLRYASQPDASDDNQLAGLVDKAMLDWSRQLREVYEDCQANIPREVRPQRCILFGRITRLEGVASRVSSVLGIPATPAELPDQFSLSEGVEFDCAGAAIGAGLSAMRIESPPIYLASSARAKPTKVKRKHWSWVAIIVWLLASVVTLYSLDKHEASQGRVTLQNVRRQTSQHGGLTRQLAVGRYLESGLSPLDVLDQITQTAPDSMLLSSWSYTADGNVSLAGTVANEKEWQDMLQKLTKIGKVELRRGQPNKGKFRIEANLEIRRKLIAAATKAPTPASQPSTKPTAPTAATKPTTTPAGGPEQDKAPSSQPTSAPSTRPAPKFTESQPAPVAKGVKP